MGKKILIITNNPARPSFRQRIEIYLQQLRSSGIDYQLEKLPSGLTARCKLFTQAKNFDAVLLQKKCLNFFDAKILSHYSRKIIYDFDDAVMFSPSSPDRNSPAHYNPFRRTTRLANTVIAGNSYLAQLAGQFNNNVTVIPTGLDTQAYKNTDKQTNDATTRLVWIGSKSTLRYLRQLTPVLEKIGSKHNNVALRIICDDFFDLENMPVEKRTWSKETEIEDLATADIGLAPLPDNRFTKGKCGFKIIQYFAAALPVVASPVGVNQDMIELSRAGLLAADNSKWFDQLDTLIPDKSLQKTLGKNASEYAKQYDKKIIGQKLRDTIATALNS